MLLPEDYVVWLEKAGLDDKSLIGEEFAGLGEIAQNHVLVSPTILVTPHAFIKFQEDNNLKLQVKHLLGTLNYDRHDSVVQVGNFLQKILSHAQIPRKIYERLFKLYERYNFMHVSLEAYYFRDGKLISRHMWTGINGEAVLAEKVRSAWAHLFTTQNLTVHNIHTHNHHTFSVCLAVRPSMQFEVTGTINTDIKKNNGEFEIIIHSDSTQQLTKHEVDTLIECAQICRKALYYPQIMHFGKSQGVVYITTIVPVSEAISYGGDYEKFMKGVSIHPGISIGRLRILDKSQKTLDISHDEIIYVDKVDKNFVSVLKKAKGLIFENDIDAEVKYLLKSHGIPTIVHGKNIKDKFMQGDVISLNATTGEVKRGSILV